MIQGDADTDLATYPDGGFDLVILSQTLQATNRPRHVLEELLRIGRRAIVSIPNFGHWRIRSQFLAFGRMPVTEDLPYSWYDTPNIHFCTIRDFVELTREVDAEIVEAYALDVRRPQAVLAGAVVVLEPVRRTGRLRAGKAPNLTQGVRPRVPRQGRTEHRGEAHLVADALRDALIELLGRLDDQHPGEGRPKPVAEAFGPAATASGASAAPTAAHRALRASRSARTACRAAPCRAGPG